MNTQSIFNCPERSELFAFSSGYVSCARLAELADHIEECEQCGLVLDELSVSGEADLVSELQKLKLGSAASPKFKVPEHLMKVACKVNDSAAQQATFDSGRSLASKLKDGPVRLGRFELLSELGVGAFGYVFKARDTKLDRTVALKVQRSGSFSSEEEIERFAQEARSVAHLDHPGIIAVYDTDKTEDGTCFLVTQFVDGETLESRLKKGRLSFKETANLVAKIADALQYAHDNGVIHRDIKPSNILIDLDGKPYVMDFGLAKRIQEANQAMTSLGRVMGTPAYMSPEQAAADSRKVGVRSDVYSLGVVLYEMITGQRPFQGDRRMLLLQVLEDEPRSPKQLEPDVPGDLATICLKALSKSQSSRYQSAGEMADDLRRFEKGDPIKARSVGRAEKLWRWCRAYPLAASLLLVVPAVAIPGFVYLFSLSTQFVQSTALESTRMEANMLEDINEYYSESVIGRLDQQRVPVTHRYMETTDSLPLPFTFLIDAGKQISENESGMQVRIYSDYPWRNNRKPMDGFEVRAIQELGLGCRTESESTGESDVRRSDKADVDGRSYHEFVEIDGEPCLRYARAQIMKQSCIDCHNCDPSSPKRNWVVGEVGGVLSITRPLKRDVDATHSVLRGAFFLIAGATVFLVGVTLCVLVSARNRSKKKIGAAFDGYR